MSGDSIEFDVVLDLGRSLQRRVVLGVLAEEQRSLTAHDLVKTILKYNDQAPITEVPDEAVTEIHLSLLHVHIPKLESAGVIEYDRERQLVEPTEEFDQLQPYLSELLALDPHIDGTITL